MINRFLNYIISIITLIFLVACIPSQPEPAPYIKPLEIVKYSENSYLHTSFIKTEKGAFIPCNGFIYVSNGEAIVFDTPLNDSISQQLIDFVQDDLKASIEGVVINHFHNDAAGGLYAFAKAGIKSYASQKTAAILDTDSLKIDHTFQERQLIRIGNDTIINSYPGAAHTRDNIVSYIPSERLLYGGCMVKSLGAREGNLSDADVSKWPQTIRAVNNAYPEVKTVIPGHGKIGGPELLDYTIELFQSKENSQGNNLE